VVRSESIAPGTVSNMCGRVVTASGPEELSKHLRIDAIVDVLEGPDHNVAPSHRLPIAWSDPDGGARLLGTARWGLLPAWAKDQRVGDRMFNARAETVADKPSFRAAFRHRRCLVVVDGFYEWGAGNRPLREPWYFHRSDGDPLVLAGLWESWVDAEEEGLSDGGCGPNPVTTCTIITVPANGDLSPVHHRMPTVLESENWDIWLGADSCPRSAYEELLTPAPDGTISRYAVHSHVNDAKNKGVELLKPVIRATVGKVQPKQCPDARGATDMSRLAQGVLW
jgi:putative SOS response-associated peptidase YedK